MINYRRAQYMIMMLCAVPAIVMFQTLFFGNPDISNSPALKNMLRFTSPFVSKKHELLLVKKYI